MAINKKYETERQASASFDWEDFTAGAGYIKFYAAGAEDGTYFLTTTDVETDNSNIDSKDSHDFDTDIFRPFNVEKGRAFVRVYTEKGSTDAVTLTVSFTRVRDGVPTVIATEAITRTGITGITTFALTIPDIESFVVGDIMRLTINISNPGNDTEYWFDPSGLATVDDVHGRTVKKQSYISLPIQIKL
jgi:hypothetical protein